MVVPNPRPTVYFGYGSNLWVDQMNRRCPENRLIGIGSLRDWIWIINARGYANIIPSPGDIVYGLVYELSESDEAYLDISEGVPVAYVKETMSIDFISRTNSPGEVGEPLPIEALVYVDFKRVVASKPKKEYIYRINKGIADATKEGIPSSYFEQYIRPFIPAIDTLPYESTRNVIDPFAPNMFSPGL